MLLQMAHNQFKPVQQSRKQVIRAYSPNTDIVSVRNFFVVEVVGGIGKVVASELNVWCGMDKSI